MAIMAAASARVNCRQESGRCCASRTSTMTGTAVASGVDCSAGGSGAGTGRGIWVISFPWSRGWEWAGGRRGSSAADCIPPARGQSGLDGIKRDLHRRPGRGGEAAFVATLACGGENQRCDQEQKEQEHKGTVAVHESILPSLRTISSSVGSGTLTIKGRNRNGRCNSRLVV